MSETTQETSRVHAEVRAFMDERVFPAEPVFEAQYAELGPHSYPPVLDDLKVAARRQGLWNLFLPHLRSRDGGTPLSNVDYAPLSEQFGKVEFASEVFNCSAPDTGNMEILFLYGSDAIKERWLTPLLEGEIRSAFAMTEPAVASSDATNVALRMTRSGDEFVLNGRKWFTSGVMSDRCKFMIVMGKTDPDGPRHEGAREGARHEGARSSYGASRPTHGRGHG